MRLLSSLPPPAPVKLIRLSLSTDVLFNLLDTYLFLLNTPSRICHTSSACGAKASSSFLIKQTPLLRVGVLIEEERIVRHLMDRPSISYLLRLSPMRFGVFPEEKGLD
ncbi:hypothetical protein PQX77_007832 [Marasmius sp. AFHP31]|nr:hypothetical protein PQX77_007832 [Marasmius sp. AFHP31]